MYQKEGEQSCSSTHIHTGKSAHVQCGTLVDALIQENHSVIISPTPGSLLLRELISLVT